MTKTNMLVVLLLLSFTSLALDKEKYYEAMSEEDELLMDEIIKELDSSEKDSETMAFLGAMLAKKSSFIKQPKEKMALFKRGVELLEEGISQSPQTVEYRFLRLTVQENCPKICNYESDIPSDKKMIVERFDELNPKLQEAIKGYAQTSLILDTAELQ